MNYQKAYMNLVLSRQALPDRRPIIYCEVHHIIPRCFGGRNIKDNLVVLTAKEHYIAHLLLTEMYVGAAKTKMIYAFWAMCKWNKKNPSGNREITAAQYAAAKQLWVSLQTGGKHSKERCDNMSKSLKGRQTHNKGGTSWAKGKKFTQQHKDNLRKSSPAPTFKGLKHSPETILKMKESATKRWQKEHQTAYQDYVSDQQQTS